jgi:hypothetical protein
VLGRLAVRQTEREAPGGLLAAAPLLLVEMDASAPLPRYDDQTRRFVPSSCGKL